MKQDNLPLTNEKLNSEKIKLTVPLFSALRYLATIALQWLMLADVGKLRYCCGSDITESFYFIHHFSTGITDLRLGEGSAAVLQKLHGLA